MGGRGLASLEDDVLVGGDVIRVNLRVVPHQLGWPEQAVEWNVVFADEVDVAAIGVVPPVPPALIVALPLSLLGRRQIADDCVVPDIDALAGSEVVDRQFDPPSRSRGWRGRGAVPRIQPLRS